MGVLVSPKNVTVSASVGNSSQQEAILDTTGQPSVPALAAKLLEPVGFVSSKEL